MRTEMRPPSSAAHLSVNQRPLPKRRPNLLTERS